MKVTVLTLVFFLTATAGVLAQDRRVDKLRHPFPNPPQLASEDWRVRGWNPAGKGGVPQPASGSMILDATYPEVIVDYRQTLREKIARGGFACDNYALTHIPAALAYMGVKRMDVQIVHWNHQISAREILTQLDLNGLKPAGPYALLALGDQYLKASPSYMIAGLGTTWPNGRGGPEVCAFIAQNRSQRLAPFMNVITVESSWRNVRLAVIRKTDPSE